MNAPKLGQAFTVKEIFDLIRDDLQRVEQEISTESIASVDIVTTIGRYLQSSGGKRLRPALLLLSSKMVGDGGQSAIRLGAVVEIIHAATLLHDDVIDVAQTRRGRPSTNVQWGNHNCVLAGDWLYMQAFQMALRERNFRILELLIGLTQMMVEGELLQLERIGRMDLSEADCMELVDRKTACLFSVCARLGALVGGADSKTEEPQRRGQGALTRRGAKSPIGENAKPTFAEEKLGEYAWNLGMAFQLVDDLLDFTASEKTLGKPVGNDLREGKVTLPLVYALERATEAERRQVENILKTKNYETVPFGNILQMIERYGGVRRVRLRAEAFTQKARAIISELPESPYQRALYCIPDLVTDRDH